MGARSSRRWSSASPRSRRGLRPGALAAPVAAPVLAIGALGEPKTREFVAFGTNMVLLRSIAWARALARRAAARAAWPALPGVLLLPTFVNGPIESAAALVRSSTVAAGDVCAGRAHCVGRRASWRRAC
jgi:hypothetical protein